MKTILKPFILIYQLFYRIFWSGLNQRSILQLVLNFSINFSPVFIWLFIFKNAGLIPHDIRPTIHVSLAYHVDTFMFSTIQGGLTTIICLLCVSMLLYRHVYLRQPVSSHRTDYIPLQNQQQEEEEEEEVPLPYEDDLCSSSSDPSDIELESFPKELTKNNSAPLDFQDDEHHKPFVLLPNMTPIEVGQMAQSTNEKIIQHYQKTGTYAPLDSWYFLPPVLLTASWFVLNFVHWLKDPIRQWEDYMAWVSYVLGHITVPIVTAVWLYVFHAPGAVKSYSLALGFMNICGVITHLVFPNAPPWFIHMNGEDAHADYDTPGYAAGLIRVDVALGTHITSKGFHASPIVFGALPSLHSAMAVMTFFFVGYYARWRVVKALAFSFVCIQWWATIYLDHHWRLDLICGMFYSIVWFTVIYKLRIVKSDAKFVKLRLCYDFSSGSTMGMRVFRNTKLQKFFDPLS
ncbi:Inositolphosphotransferase 1 [Candida viswanathii]|uniref:Inositolphosphotransferase 1 n=1 Tax=Candida viswanathii TaxID=5486 RepID=A0A367XUX3_9ASCO|nr:Inositolphosphotransferase 1 [Candida viswanathii]